MLCWGRILGRSRETSRQSSVNSNLARPSPRSNPWVVGATSTLNQTASHQLSTNKDLNKIKFLSSLRGIESRKHLNKIKDLSRLKYLNNPEQLHSHRDLYSLKDLNNPEEAKRKTFPLNSHQDLSSQGFHLSRRIVKAW